MTETRPTSTPRNKRLNSSDREFLLDFAKQNIKVPAEEAALDEAYKAARKVCLLVVHAKYPPKHMKLMLQYGCAKPDLCIRFGGGYDHESAFNFKKDDPAIPLVPSISSCTQRQYEWTKEQRAVMDAYVLARQAHDKALAEKFQTYRRLILGSTTFNDITSVWPAAETLRARLIPETQQQRALAVLSEDAIALIRADNAGGSQKAAA